MMPRSRLAVILFLLLFAACKKKPPITPDEVPDYAGTWTGNYVVTGCTQSGFFASANFCAQVTSTPATVTFTFTQTDRAVSGTFLLGSLPFPTVNATVADDGSLSFSAAGTDPTFPIDASWALRQQVAGTVTGQTHQVWHATGQTGEGVLDGRLDGATK